MFDRILEKLMKNHESLMAHYKSQIATLKCDLEKNETGRESFQYLFYRQTWRDHKHLLKQLYTGLVAL